MKEQFKKLNITNPYIRIIAIVLFVMLPFLGFYLGYTYGYNTQLDEVETPCANQCENTPEAGDVQSNTEDTEDNEQSDAEDAQSPEDTRIAYEYTFKGKNYTLYIDNPENYEYSLQTQGYDQPRLDIKVNSDVTLSILAQNEMNGPGVYGEFKAEINEDIVRNRYNPGVGNVDSYNQKASDEDCGFETTDQYPCIVVGFHNDSDGSLEAYVNYSEVPSDAVFKSVDDMIRSYTIK